MKKSNRLFIAVLIVLCTVSASALYAQDFARLSERTLAGTARYVGMGGAMTAIGGDPSAVMDNTAGLGLYRRMEVMATIDVATPRLVTVPQASVVFSFPTNNPNPNGVLFHNLMLSYHRLHSYGRTVEAGGEHMPSLGALFASTGVDLGMPYGKDRYNVANGLVLNESGSVSEYALHWAMNIGDRWYWGLGLRIQSFSLSSEAEYIETFRQKNENGDTYYNRNATTVLLSGAGCSLSTGVIYRPLSWLRLGASFETPSVGSFSTSTAGTLYAQTDSLRQSDAPELIGSSSSFHAPLHTSASVAFQVSRYALIALQYDYRYHKGVPDLHSLRAGVEIVPVAGLYINLGYAYETPSVRTTEVVSVDKTLDSQDAYFQYFRRAHYASAGIGFRGRHMIVQAAYQYRLQQQDLFAHELAPAFDLTNDTHRVTLTLGWHRTK